MKVKLTIVCCALMLSALSLKGQQEADTLKVRQLKEVVATGTRTERSVSTLPLPTQVIAGESIRQSGLSRLNEIIQEQTGLFTVPDFGGGEGIQIQGLDAAYTMILIDGQPLVGRLAGTLDLSRISVNNVERIEVIKGASSCLYGSEAMAGVINIITRQTDVGSNLHLNANYKVAAFNTHDASMNVSKGINNKIGLELFGNYYSSGGYNLSTSSFFNTVEPFHNLTIQPKLKFNITKKLSLQTNARFYRQSQNNKGLIDDQQFNGKSNIDEQNYTLLINHLASEKLKLSYDFYATHYQTDEYLNDPSGALFSSGNYDHWFLRPELRSHLTLGKSTLTTGLGLNQETLDRTLFKERAQLHSEYLFGQLEWFIGKQWNVLAGFRYDHHHQYQSQLSPKLAVNFKWNDNFSLKGSAGYGYKAPDLRQLYLNFTNSTVGYTVLGYNVVKEGIAALQNQGEVASDFQAAFADELKPESSMNLNFGGFYHKHRLTADFNIFYNAIANLIDTKTVVQKIGAFGGQSVFSYFNVDQVFTYGLEVNSKYQLLKDLEISGGYQFLIAKDRDALQKLDKGEVFARDKATLATFKLEKNDYFGLYNRSRHTANFKFTYNLSALKTRFNARLLYRSKYGLLDGNDNALLDKFDQFVKGYLLTNIAATTAIKKNLSLQIGANNIFNHIDRQNIPNLPGRQLFTRLQFQF